MSTIEISESDTSYEDLLNQVAVGILHVNLDGIISFANECCAEILGLKKSELEGKRYFGSGLEYVSQIGLPIGEEDHPLFEAAHSGKTTKNFVMGVFVEKQIVWISGNATPFFSPEREVIGGLLCFNATTEKVKLEQEYDEETTKNKHLSESVHAVFWEWSLADDRMAFVGPRVEEMLGYTVQERSTKGFWESKIHPEDKEWTISFHQSQVALGRSHEFEYRFEKKDGEYIWIKDIIDVFVENGKSVLLKGLMVDISRQKIISQKLKESEALKQEILNSLEDAILVVDKNGAIISINKRLEIYLKKSPYHDVRVGGNVFSFVNFFEEKDLIQSGFEKVLKRTATFFDYETKLADGKWYNLKVTQLKTPYGAVISWQNINTRKEIEIALEKSLKKYRNIYNRAPVMMHSINSNAEIMSVSDFWLEKMGYERKEVIGKRTIDFVTEETQNDALRKVKDFFKKGYSKNVPYQFRTKSGEVLEVLLSATSEYDEDGNFERSLAGMVDVTELKKTERELVKNRQNLLEAQRISRIGNYELDFNDYDFTPSPEAMAMLGLSEDQIDLRTLEGILHISDKEEFLEKLADSKKTGVDFFHIYRIHHLKSGITRWISARGKVKKDEEGTFCKMIGTLQDISEQKVAEDKIRRLSDRILLATELAEIGVWEFSSENDEVYWDKQMHEIFESKRNPVKNLKEFANHVVKDDLLILEEITKKIKSGARFIESDLRLIVNDKIKYVRTYTRIIRDSNAHVSRFIGVMYDNTRDKKLQLKLETSLEEKNVLLKEVHHRVKNNMQLVSSILALKSYELEDANAKKLFTEINDRIKSMAVIHDQLYKFYNVSEINISDYLNHIARELRILLGTKNTEIVVDADDKVFEVDKVLLFGLIVSELVSNAFKHSFNIKKHGNVHIIFKKEGKVNSLSVLNDGEKVPENILKEKSAGLGISLIKTFARQLNGELSLSEENGFQIVF
ncbi:MAG: PAS domain-containing protein [Cyclobacteriaceae bacterium]